MKPIFPYIKPHIKQMLLGFIIKFTGTMMDLMIPWVLSYLLENVVITKNVPLIFRWGFFMVFCSITALITNIIANRMAASVSRKITRSLRHDLFERIGTLSSRQIDTFTIPSLESRLTSDTYNINQAVNMVQRVGIRAPILLLGGICITMILEPVLSLVMVSILPFITLFVWLISRKGIPLFRMVQKSVDRLVLKVREDASGIRVIKALSRGSWEKSMFDRINKETVKKDTTATLTMGLTSPIMSFCLNAGMVLVIAVGAIRANAGAASASSIIAFLTYFSIILNAMLSITRIFTMYSKASASAARIEEVLCAPDDFTITPASPAQNDNHIVFEDVSFAYSGTAETLSHISFCLKRGETLGIIGPTGSGKSSIINLLLRMYDPNSGSIQIFGKDLCSFPLEELRTKFGIVFQNDVLFAGSIRENIDFGRHLSDAQIEQAARCAQAAEFIDSMPDGLDHHLCSKGTNLSGGQRQRVLLARALAGNSEILILDDSSSALDYHTDASLRKALRKEYSNITTIIIAQRISSILHCDHILVLEQGKIIGYGNHEELLRSCPLYREIRQSQMGGAL